MASTLCRSCPLTGTFVRHPVLTDTPQPEASSSHNIADSSVRLKLLKKPASVVKCMQSQSSVNVHGPAAQTSSSASLSTQTAPSSSPEDSCWKLHHSSNGSDTRSKLKDSSTHLAEINSSLFPDQHRSILNWNGQAGDQREAEHSDHKTATTRRGVPVFVMLPLDTVNMDNTLNMPEVLDSRLLALKSAGVEGVMVDAWWGIVEKDGPGVYNWSAYSELFGMVREHGLKVQAVMSFHQCGGNVGDNCSILLPPWVLEEVQKNPDLAYTDKAGARNAEYISLGADNVPALKGRTPVQCYADFMRSFRDNFQGFLGDVIAEIHCGMGPAGELRYPSYPESEGKWKFPGVGEFQSYDKYMMASLRANAEAPGKPEWGNAGGPHDAGNYDQMPEETGFFKRDGTWSSDYGQFFMEWYSEMLLAHGHSVLSVATGIFRGTGAVISGKIAGIHWHYNSRSHAAELTAGYYNSRSRDGYASIAQMFSKHGVSLNFTCLEMRDYELQPYSYARCSPEGLVRQVAVAARGAGIPMAGENALSRFDSWAHDQILRNSRLRMNEEGEDCHEEYEPMAAFTYLRMCENLFHGENWTSFVCFVRSMEEGRMFQACEVAQAHREEAHKHATSPVVQEFV